MKISNKAIRKNKFMSVMSRKSVNFSLELRSGTCNFFYYLIIVDISAVVQNKFQNDFKLV